MTETAAIQSPLTQSMPKGAVALLLMQVFSTISYAVMYSTFILYITKALHFSSNMATSLTGMFFAFNYGLHLLGGFIGGRFLSFRTLFCIGMLLLTVGCVLIAIPALPSFYLGSAAFLTGSGLNVTCINCMLTQLFAADDKRREKAFLWNWSGMNLGFFVGFAVAGWFQQREAYHALFLLSGTTNIIALLLALMNWKVLRDINTSLATSMHPKRQMVIGLLLIALLFFALTWLVKNPVLSQSLVIYTTGAMLLFVIYIILRTQQMLARQKLWAYLIFAIMSLTFWTVHELFPNGLTLFTENNVNRHLVGLQIPPQWFGNINPVVVMLGGPLLSWLFQKLRRLGFNVNIPAQFGWALLFIGISMIILPIGIHFADSQGFSSSQWVIATYVLLSIGELFIGPVGYAMIGQLVPNHLQGALMGIWMLMIGCGEALAGYFSKIAASNAPAGASPLVSNTNFAYIFSLLGAAAITCGIIIFLLGPFLRRLIQEPPHTAH